MILTVASKGEDEMERGFPSEIELVRVFSTLSFTGGGDVTHGREE